MEKELKEFNIFPAIGIFPAELEDIPSRTGVYLMKDERGEVLYVGKAKDLKTRVRSYFTGQGDSRPSIPYLIGKVKSIDTIITDSEKEALILENLLIKKHRPRYNVNFRDDKNYFSLRIDLASPFPRLQLVRKVKKDGAIYFGPYVSSNAVKETLKVIQENFPLRTCRDQQFKNRSRPCINFEIGRCSAPCVGKIDKEGYKRFVEGAILFLKGKNRELISTLKREMKEASVELRFEDAARIRDRILAIEKTIEGQKVVNYRGGDVDIHAWQVEDGRMAVQILHVREGKLMDSRPFAFSIKSLPPEEAFSSFLKQYYSQNRQIPDEILIPHHLDEMDAIEGWLSDERGKRVKVKVPVKGEAKRLMEMARENALNALKEFKRKDERIEDILDSLGKRAGLRKRPRIIECIDISDIGGKEAVGSVIRFEDGMPAKGAYRRYRIKTVEGADDYAMMYEVLYRHINRRRDEGLLPDLILADGGKGHLGVVMEVLKDLKIDSIEAIAIAKFRIRKGKRMDPQRDRIYIPHAKDPVEFPKGSPELLLLQRIRDEAHRFGLTYHKRLRQKKGTQSIFDNISGIGNVRRMALLKHFGGLDGLKEASLKELMEVPGISKRLAENIHNYLHSSENNERESKKS